MSDDKIIFDPRFLPTEQIPPEEQAARRLMAVAVDLANPARPPGEWKVWYKRRAEELGIPPEELEALVVGAIEGHKERAAERRLRMSERRLEAQLAEAERKNAKERAREQRHNDEASARKGKQKGKAFAAIVKLPADEHEDRLVELAVEQGEDISALRAEFADYRSRELPTPSEWDIEPWGEPVAIAALLQELIERIDLHVKAKPHQVLATALWILMSWVHKRSAHYSVYLVITGPREDCGKTTLLIEVIGRLVSKAYACSADPTVSSVFRTADRDHPSMLFDNVDDLFDRKREVANLFETGWIRGVPYPRSEKIAGEWRTVRYDPFCPKACSLIGTNIPPALLSRCMLIELWPLKPGETIVEVDPFDLELLEAFTVLRRKALRWSNDNAEALKSAQPLFPAGFIGRPRANAILLLAIAELAGGDWPKQARDALDKLLRAERESDWLDLLLEELWVVFVVDKRQDITSAALVERLTADPTSPWLEYGARAAHRVTQREVAALLRKVHIRTHQIGEERLHGYRRQDFLENEIFEHFLKRYPFGRSDVSDEPSSGRSDVADEPSNG